MRIFEGVGVGWGREGRGVGGWEIGVGFWVGGMFAWVVFGLMQGSKYGLRKRFSWFINWDIRSLEYY